jgi:hypothetical protein
MEKLSKISKRGKLSKQVVTGNNKNTVLYKKNSKANRINIQKLLHGYSTQRIAKRAALFTI